LVIGYWQLALGYVPKLAALPLLCQHISLKILLTVRVKLFARMKNQTIALKLGT
jgi:hypothetical protein